MNSLVAIKEIKFIIYKFSEICKTNFMREFQQMFEDNIHTSSAQFRPENGKETLPNWFYEAITMTLKPDKIKCKKKKRKLQTSIPHEYRFKILSNRTQQDKRIIHHEHMESI